MSRSWFGSTANAQSSFSLHALNYLTKPPLLPRLTVCSSPSYILVWPDGIMSQDSLKKYRRNLADLGLIIEQIEEGPRPKMFLVITKKGRRIAEKIREIMEILEE